MNYKTKDEYFKESLLFRCKCGEYAFLIIEKVEYSDNEPDYYLSFVEQPNGFFQRLKWLFKPDKYVREIILSKSDIKELIKKVKE